MRRATTGNAGALLGASGQKGWITVRSSSDAAWSQLKLPSDVRSRIEDQLRAGYAVVAPDPTAVADDLVQPGHVFPLRAKPGGVLQRAGHTEAAVDLVKLAGGRPIGVICEIMSDDGSMARLPELIKIAQKHRLKICTIADLIKYRTRTESLVRRVPIGPPQVAGHTEVHQNGRAAGSCDQPLAMSAWLGELTSAQACVKLGGGHAVQDARIMNIDALNSPADRVTGEHLPEALDVG